MSAWDNQAGLQHRSWDSWLYEDYTKQFKARNFGTQRSKLSQGIKTNCFTEGRKDGQHQGDSTWQLSTVHQVFWDSALERWAEAQSICAGSFARSKFKYRSMTATPRLQPTREAAVAVHSLHRSLTPVFSIRGPPEPWATGFFFS